MAAPRFSLSILGLGVLGLILSPPINNSEAPSDKPTQAAESVPVNLTLTPLAVTKTDPAGTITKKISDQIGCGDYKSGTPCLGGQKLRFLVATVPDPTAPRLASLLDGFLDSIVRAANEERYAIEGHWLPWRPTQEMSDGKFLVSWLSGERERKEREQGTLPGLIFFRQVLAQDTRLVVFLIPESPVVGLNKTAFRTSLECIRRFQGGSLQHAWILGPAFSGSVPSLKDLLKEDQPDGHHFCLVTGTATDASNESQIEELNRSSVKSVEYHSVVENDSVAFEAFVNYVRSHREEEKDIAVVAEAGTAFGASFASEAQPAIRLSFPSQIARLRNAYQQDPELSHFSTTQVPRSTLELNLKDKGDGGDAIPTYSPEHTSVSQEITLRNVATSIRRRHILYAAIGATDVLDSLFVSSFLRVHAGDVRQVSFSNDILYQHSSPGKSFYGNLVVTNYPFLRSHRHLQGKETTLHFSSAATQGVFNACRLALGFQQKQACFRDNPAASRASLLHLVSKGNRSASQDGPPIWLMVVGRDRLWPVQVLKRGDKAPSSLAWFSESRIAAERSDTASSSSVTAIDFNFIQESVTPDQEAAQTLAGHETDSPSRLWDVILVWFSLWSAWYVAAPFLKRDAVGFRGGLQEARGCFKSALPYRFLALACRLAIMAPLLFIQVAYGLEADQGFRSILAVLGLLSTVLLVWGLFEVLIAMLTERRPPASFLRDAGTGLLVIAAVIALCFWWVASLFFNDEDHYGRFLVLRSVIPASGVSPVFPVIALLFGIASWADMQVRRHNLVKYWDPGVVDLEGSGMASLRSLTEFMTGLREAQRRAINIKRDWPALLGVVLFLVAVKINTLEPPGIKWVLASEFSLLITLLLLTGFRLLDLWLTLRPILARLAGCRLGKVFERLACDFNSQTIWSGGATLNRTLLQSLERLDCISPECPARLLRPIEHNLPAVMATKRYETVGPQLKEINHAMNEIASAIAPRLNTGKAISLKEAQEEFIGARLVAFIRYQILHLKELVGFLGLGFVCLLVAINVYPLHPHRTLVLWSTILFVILSAMALLVLANLDRDPLLSRLRRTHPGKLDSNFFIQLAYYGTIPLLALLASQFPTAGHYLFSWIGPLFQSLR